MFDAHLGFDDCSHLPCNTLITRLTRFTESLTRKVKRLSLATQPVVILENPVPRGLPTSDSSWKTSLLVLDLSHLRYSQPDRRSQTFNQRFLIERLAQEGNRTIFERARPVVLVRISGNQND